MIEVLIDNNALVSLCVRKDYDDLAITLKTLFDKGRLGVNFNCLTFLEQLMGTNSDLAFENARDRIRKADRITSKNFLLPPDAYARKAIGIMGEDEAIKIAQDWFREFRSLCSCDSRSDFDKALLKLQDNFRDHISKTERELNKLRNESLQILRGKKIDNIEEYLLENGSELASFRKGDI
jgi:hypothetical protein